MNRARAISAAIGGTAILAAVTVAGVAVVNAASATTPADQKRTVVSDQSLEPTADPTPTRLPDVVTPASDAPASDAPASDIAPGPDTAPVTDEESQDSVADDQGDSSGSDEGATDDQDPADSAQTDDNASATDSENDTDGGPTADDGQDDDHGSVDDGGHGGEGDDGDDD